MQCIQIGRLIVGMLRLDVHNFSIDVVASFSCVFPYVCIVRDALFPSIDVFATSCSTCCTLLGGSGWGFIFFALALTNRLLRNENPLRKNNVTLPPTQINL